MKIKNIFIILIFSLLINSASATIIEIHDGDDFEAKVANLTLDDDAYVYAGTYEVGNCAIGGRSDITGMEDGVILNIEPTANYGIMLSYYAGLYNVKIVGNGSGSYEGIPCPSVVLAGDATGVEDSEIVYGKTAVYFAEDIEDYNTVDNCTIHDCGTGLSSSTYGLITVDVGFSQDPECYNICVENCNIYNCSGDLPAIYMAYCESVYIHNNVIDGVKNHAIYTYKNNKVTIDYNTITNMNGSGKWGIYNYPWLITTSYPNSINYNTIENIGNNNGIFIKLIDVDYGGGILTSGTATISNNDITNCDGTATYLDLHSTKITSNVHHNNYVDCDSSIYINGYSTNIVANNIYLNDFNYTENFNETLNPNAKAISLYQTRDNKVYNNTISNSPNIGINIYESNFNKYYYNRIHGASYGINFETDGTAYNEIYLNDFFDISGTYYYNPETTNSYNSTSEISYTFQEQGFLSRLGNYYDEHEAPDENLDGLADTGYEYTYSDIIDNYTRLFTLDGDYTPTEFEDEEPPYVPPSSGGGGGGYYPPIINDDVVDDLNETNVTLNETDLNIDDSMNLNVIENLKDKFNWLWLLLLLIIAYLYKKYRDNKNKKGKRRKLR